MIHQYINNGYHIILDINSGSVHIADALLYDAVEIAQPLIGELAEPEKIKKEVFEEIRAKLLEKSYPEEEIEEALSDM